MRSFLGYQQQVGNVMWYVIYDTFDKSIIAINVQSWENGLLCNQKTIMGKRRWRKAFLCSFDARRPFHLFEMDLWRCFEISTSIQCCCCCCCYCWCSCVIFTAVLHTFSRTLIFTFFPALFFFPSSSYFLCIISKYYTSNKTKQKTRLHQQTINDNDRNNATLHHGPIIHKTN